MGAQELTLNHPSIVNGKKNTELLYAAPAFLARGLRRPTCTGVKP